MVSASIELSRLIFKSREYDFIESDAIDPCQLEDS